MQVNLHSFKHILFPDTGGKALDNKQIQSMADKYNVSIPQLCSDILPPLIEVGASCSIKIIQFISISSNLLFNNARLYQYCSLIS